MAEVTKKLPARQWPGAWERGLQVMPELSPLVVDLAAPEAQCWMNISAAEKLKGSPLTGLELRRIYRGQPFRSAAGQERLRRQQARAQGSI